MVGLFSERGLCSLKFLDQINLEIELSEMEEIFEAEFICTTTKLSEQLNLELREYFRRERKKFSVPLDIVGTPFQLKVWDKLMQIPYGSTSSYKEQAIALDKATAIRAVANANGQNRIAILVPCHRVIGHNGTLVGYNGGLEIKRFLLDLEKNSREVTHIPV